MKFSQELPDVNTIQAYAEGQIEVSTRETGESELRLLTASFIIMPEKLLTGWPPQQTSELQPVHFAQLAELEPEMVLLGSGRRLLFPEPYTTVPLMERGIGLEVMDTGAACRTYNILAGEGRRVAAALMMIQGP